MSGILPMHHGAARANGSRSGDLVKFDPSSSRFACSQELRKYNPISPFSHHGPGYISLVAAADKQFLTMSGMESSIYLHPTSKSPHKPVEFVIKSIKFEVDKDLIPDDCIGGGDSLGEFIRLGFTCDRDNKLSSLELLRNDGKTHFTLTVSKCFGSEDYIIDLIKHVERLKVNDREIYTGNLTSGEMTDDTGNATYTWNDANGRPKLKYEGKIIDGKMTDNTGRATYTWYDANGRPKLKYEGKIIDGKRTDDTGRASYTRYNVDGSIVKYTGKVSNNKRTDETGNATYTWNDANGRQKSKYKGKFINGKRADDTGRATYTDSYGIERTVTVIDGIMKGLSGVVVPFDELGDGDGEGDSDVVHLLGGIQ